MDQRECSKDNQVDIGTVPFLSRVSFSVRDKDNKKRAQKNTHKYYMYHLFNYYSAPFSREDVPYARKVNIIIVYEETRGKKRFQF